MRIATPAARLRGHGAGDCEGGRSWSGASAAARAKQPPGVGVGIPGTVVRATGLVKNANSTWLNASRLERDLTAALARPCAAPTTPTAWRLGGNRRSGGWRGASLRGDSGTGCGGGIGCGMGKVRVGAKRSLRRVGHNPCPGQRPMNCPGPSASAASAAVSRHGSPAPGLRATICE